MFEFSFQTKSSPDSARALKLQLKKVVADVCNVDAKEIRPNSELASIGSQNKFAAIDIYQRIEGRIGLDIPDLRGKSINMYDFMGFHTFQDLYSYLSEDLE